MAAEMLIEQLNGQNAPRRQHLFAAELVVRESTGPAARARGAVRPARTRRNGAADSDV
jgi:hypothetical protein